jgi:uroporphyrinogen-III synthase
MSFGGKRVLSLESRRAAETAELIRRYGGEPFVAPSMRDVPIENNEEAFRFAERLFAGEFQMMIFLTGVGTRYLHKVIASRHGEEAFPAGLRKLTTVARGPKPAAALRELKVQVDILVPEPNTWREIVDVLEARSERRIAVQEYGRPAKELIEALSARGAELTPVPVYQWDLPEDLAPLREAAKRIAEGGFDVVIFTTSNQIVHLVEVASGMGVSERVLRGLGRLVVASVGPTTTETLKEYGIEVDVEPSHPKLGFLVKETAEQADQVLRSKRADAPIRG